VSFGANPRATEEALALTFSALADPSRRRAVELLQSTPLRAGDLAAALRLSPAAMSRHLRVLRQAGLIEEEPTGNDLRLRVYRLRPQRFRVLRTWLSEVEAFWEVELAAFKTHAERTHGPKGSNG
jgi:DNA-binding transcriptional ArsR family regulator